MLGAASTASTGTLQSRAKALLLEKKEISHRRIVARRCTAPLDATSGSLFDGNQPGRL